MAANSAAPAMREISAWDLCKWAYGRECVRHLVRSDRDWRPGGPGITATALAQRAMLLGAHIRSTGGTPVTPTAPDDAIALHAWLSLTVGAEDAWQVMLAAERGQPPEWSPTLPDLKVEMVLDETRVRPRPKIYYRDRACTKPSFCPIRYRGLTDDEKEQARREARAKYAVFCETLGKIVQDVESRDLHLVGFVVTKIGINPRPWA